MAFCKGKSHSSKCDLALSQYRALSKDKCGTRLRNGSTLKRPKNSLHPRTVEVQE
jgi:hypothetical protein